MSLEQVNVKMGACRTDINVLIFACVGLLMSPLTLCLLCSVTCLLCSVTGERYQLTSLRLYTHKPETYTSRTDQTLVWQAVHEATGRPVLTAGCLCLQGPRVPSSSMRLRPGKSRPAPAPRRALPSGSVGRPPLWTFSSRIPHQSLSEYACAMFNALFYNLHVLICCFLRLSCSCVHHYTSSCRCEHDGRVFYAAFALHNLCPALPGCAICLCMFCITGADQSSSNLQCEMTR